MTSNNLTLKYSVFTTLPHPHFTFKFFSCVFFVCLIRLNSVNCIRNTKQNSSFNCYLLCTKISSFSELDLSMLLLCVYMSFYYFMSFMNDCNGQYVYTFCTTKLNRFQITLNIDILLLIDFIHFVCAEFPNINMHFGFFSNISINNAFILQ